jgi:hypothetical protein
MMAILTTVARMSLPVAPRMIPAKKFAGSSAKIIISREERRMLYADLGYWIAHVHSRTKKPLGRAYRSGGRDNQAKAAGSVAC